MVSSRSSARARMSASALQSPRASRAASTDVFAADERTAGSWRSVGVVPGGGAACVAHHHQALRSLVHASHLRPRQPGMSQRTPLSSFATSLPHSAHVPDTKPHSESLLSLSLCASDVLDWCSSVSSSLSVGEPLRVALLRCSAPRCCRAAPAAAAAPAASAGGGRLALQAVGGLSATAAPVAAAAPPPAAVPPAARRPPDAAAGMRNFDPDGAAAAAAAACRGAAVADAVAAVAAAGAAAVAVVPATVSPGRCRAWRAVVAAVVVAAMPATTRLICSGVRRRPDLGDGLARTASSLAGGEVETVCAGAAAPVSAPLSRLGPPVRGRTVASAVPAARRGRGDGEATVRCRRAASVAALPAGGCAVRAGRGSSPAGACWRCRCCGCEARRAGRGAAAPVAAASA